MTREDDKRRDERAGERAGAGANAPKRDQERDQDKSGTARRVEAAKEQNRPDQPGGYKQVHARPEDEQREVEKAVQDDLEARRRAEDEKKRQNQPDQNAKSAQKPMSDDGKSSHPSQTGATQGGALGQQRGVLGMSESDQRREIERGEQETGRGVSSLNQGPSDTVSPNPHAPANYEAARGGSGGPPNPGVTGGTGQAPPTGENPANREDTKEKPSL